MKKKKFAPKGWLPVKLAIGKYALIPLRQITPEHVSQVRSSILREGGLVGAPQRERKSALTALTALGASAADRKSAEVLKFGWWTMRVDDSQDFE